MLVCMYIMDGQIQRIKHKDKKKMYGNIASDA